MFRSVTYVLGFLERMTKFWKVKSSGAKQWKAFQLSGAERKHRME